MTENQSQVADGRFPDGFVWGTATASYQIEGAVHEDGRSESIWDRFSRTPGKTSNGDTGDVACDHYHRWREDIATMCELGVAAYRFSIAWPRVIPTGRGAVNEPGIAFYDQLVDALIEAGITPWVTLYHWDLPQVLEDQGGWPNRDTAHAFTEYVDVVTRRLGDRVKHWITLNEPWCSGFLGYYTGHHAPGRTSLADAFQAFHTLHLAHGLAVPIVRRNSPDAQVGITLNLSQIYPASDSAADRAAAQRQDALFNQWFLDPLYGRGYPEDAVALLGEAAPKTEPGDLEVIAAPTDFLGINYYTPAFVRDAPGEGGLAVEQVRQEGEYTAMDWFVYPQGLYDLMQRVHRDYPTGPLYITENGAAYEDAPPQDGRVADPERTRYYELHLAACRRAIDDGVPLAGYFAWSLMDNFEWAFGYTRRFGIVYVDFATQERTIKDSGHWFSRVVRENRVVPIDEASAAQPRYTKAELAREIEGAWTKLNGGLDRLSQAQMTDIRDAQGWAVKDHLVHMAAWERSVAVFLQGQPRSEGLGVDEQLYLTGDDDAINAAIQEQWKDVSLAEALAEFRKVHTQLLSLIEPMSDDDLHKASSMYQPAGLDDPDERPIIGMIYSNTANHFREHQEWIESLVSQAS